MSIEIYNKMPPRGKRWLFFILIIVLSVIVGCILLFGLIPFLSGKLDGLTINEIIISLTVIISIIVIVITLAKDALKYEYTTKHTLKLSAKVEDDIVIFTCLFKNESRNRIFPRNFYLFIDGASVHNVDRGYFEFDNILHHEQSAFDCELGKICKGEVVLAKYPEQLIKKDSKSIYNYFYHLKHLSPNSVSFIDPGEVFSEDITIKLDSGVYRAILVGTSRNHDCVCSNVQFVIRTQKTTAKECISTHDGVKQ